MAPATKGFGYATDYAKRAAEKGLEPAELAREAEAAKPPDPDRAAKVAARKVTTEAIAGELKAIRDPGPQEPSVPNHIPVGEPRSPRFAR